MCVVVLTEGHLSCNEYFITFLELKLKYCAAV